MNIVHLSIIHITTFSNMNSTDIPITIPNPREPMSITITANQTHREHPDHPSNYERAKHSDHFYPSHLSQQFQLL